MPGLNDDLLTPLWRASRPPRLSDRQWELLLAQARCARLSGRLACLCADRGWFEAMPAGARDHLRGLLHLVLTRRDHTLWEIDCLRRALRGSDIPAVLLKGAAYVAGQLPPWRGRLFADVDVLVPRARLRDAEAALLAAGWVAQRLDPYDERYYRDLMHELPPLQHVERGTTLDLHHTIAPPTSRWPIDGAVLLAAAVPVPAQAPFLMLAPADMVLHSMLHLMQDGDFSAGLRDLLDIDDLLALFGRDPAFWPALAERARQLGVSAPMTHALDQLERLFDTRMPEHWQAEFDSLAPGRPRRRAMQWLLERALRPSHPACELPGSAAARALLYVRSHWLRMPWHQIVPHLLRKAWVRARERWKRPRAEPGPALPPRP